MVSLTKFVVVLLLVLPCLLSVDAKKSTASPNTCQLVSVSATLTSSGRYNSYQATVRNTGSTTVSSIVLSTSADLREVDGVTESGDSKYTLSNTDSLEAGETYSFTYNVRQQTTVNWSVTCTAVTATPSRVTAAPTTTTKAPTTKAAKTTTTTTTKAPTTKAPTTKAPTTAAPTKAATTTTTKTAAAQTTKAAATQTTVAPATGATTAATGGKTCSSGWWRPGPATTWQWQLTGTIDTTLDVQMYDIDLFDATPALINKLHAAGKTVICYFSTQYENWRPDAAQFPASTLGNNLDDWAGEKYVDVRSAAVRAVMAARMDLAVSKGCDGLEPDNVDGYQATTGFPIKAADQIDYNVFLANQAHARGLSVGLKNDGDQAAALQPYFDWALNEQCNQYSECTPYNVFINAGKAVFNCEYSGSASSVCPKMATAKFSTLFKKLALDASVSANCCTYASGGCAKAAYKCVTNASAKRSVEAEEPAHDENAAQETKMSAAPARTPALTVVCACAAAAAALALLL